MYHSSFLLLPLMSLLAAFHGLLPHLPRRFSNSSKTWTYVNRSRRVRIGRFCACLCLLSTCSDRDHQTCLCFIFIFGRESITWLRRSQNKQTAKRLMFCISVDLNSNDKDGVQYFPRWKDQSSALLSRSRLQASVVRQE